MKCGAMLNCGMRADRGSQISKRRLKVEVLLVVVTFDQVDQLLGVRPETFWVSR